MSTFIISMIFFISGFLFGRFFSVDRATHKLIMENHELAKHNLDKSYELRKEAEEILKNARMRTKEILKNARMCTKTRNYE